MYTLSHTSLESLKRVLASFLSINSARGINKDLLYPLMFIMHDIACFEMQIKSPWERLCEDLLEDHRYVKYHSETKVYVNLHAETRGYVKFHSETKEDVIFTPKSKRM